MANDTKPAEQAPAATTCTVEDWCKAKKTPAFLFAAAKVMNGWPVGQLLTEEQFDKGIQNQPISR